MKLTPRDFFLHIAVMATLYVSVFSFISLLFHLIDTTFPKEIGIFRDPYSSGISFALAALIIIFPLYLFFTRALNRDLRTHTEKQDLGIRKWLIFITLFVAGAAIIIDLIVLLSTFFSGQELTIGFLLKVATILIVIGAVFWYYFKDLKGEWYKQEKFAQAIGIAVGGIVLVSIVGGFFILGSPQTQRLKRIDQQKVYDLQNIQSQVISFWQQKEGLPQTLAELEDPLVGFVVPLDPQTGESYGYRVTGALSFELCAVFNREDMNASLKEFERPMVVGLEGASVPLEANWQHGVGEVCFERTIDPERLLLPPRKE